ncbi:hypothetical protein B0H10DRAFT_1325158 [Mycena sp. CBHHK59/15]|nr:hypothetical protein B0H10DRAFT_1325158 [Mycena sp. CBHHK59/15]
MVVWAPGGGMGGVRCRLGGSGGGVKVVCGSAWCGWRARRRTRSGNRDTQARGMFPDSRPGMCSVSGAKGEQGGVTALRFESSTRTAVLRRVRCSRAHVGPPRPVGVDDGAVVLLLLLVLALLVPVLDVGMLVVPRSSWHAPCSSPCYSPPTPSPPTADRRLAANCPLLLPPFPLAADHHLRDSLLVPALTLFLLVPSFGIVPSSHRRSSPILFFASIPLTARLLRPLPSAVSRALRSASAFWCALRSASAFSLRSASDVSRSVSDVSRALRS